MELRRADTIAFRPFFPIASHKKERWYGQIPILYSYEMISDVPASLEVKKITEINTNSGLNKLAK